MKGQTFKDSFSRRVDISESKPLDKDEEFSSILISSSRPSSFKKNCHGQPVMKA